MEPSSEDKRQLWNEVSRANEVRMKVEGKQWRKHFFLYLGVIVATVAIASVLANLGR